MKYLQYIIMYGYSLTPEQEIQVFCKKQQDVIMHALLQDYDKLKVDLSEYSIDKFPWLNDNVTRIAVALRDPQIFKMSDHHP